MRRYSDPNTRFDRVNAIVWVAAVHLALAAFMTLGTRTKNVAPVPPPTTQLIEIAPDSPPPPPRPEAARAEEGASGRRAKATPVVAPEPRVQVETASPLSAARIAGAGATSNAGGASAGRGSGAGGTGSGPGGGGAGGTGVAIGQNARLLSGGLSRRDYRLLRSFSAPEGRAVVAILVGPQGTVERCRIAQSSGDERADRALCAILAPRMVWAPAHDENGRPVAVGIDYTAVWSRY